MKFFNALLYYCFIIPISLLPYKVLYAFSDGLFYLMYYVIKYRKAVVLKNISRSFPEKKPVEHTNIAKQFYRHFCDVILESFKIFTISEDEVKKRMIVVNPELFTPFYEQKRSIIFAGGHFNNWELFAVAINPPVKHQVIAIYKRLRNKYFDEKMRQSRGKFGLKLISTKVVKEEFETEKQNLTATIFAIDQSPSKANNCYWTTFLNQETAVAFGTEKYAKEYNYPVVFGHIEKVKRGFYQLKISLITAEPTEAAPGEIMEKLTKTLENDIIANPQYWLWTHKRWKLKKPSQAN